MQPTRKNLGMLDEFGRKLDSLEQLDANFDGIMFHDAAHGHWKPPVKADMLDLEGIFIWCIWLESMSAASMLVLFLGPVFLGVHFLQGTVGMISSRSRSASILPTSSASMLVFMLPSDSLSSLDSAASLFLLWNCSLLPPQQPENERLQQKVSQS